MAYTIKAEGRTYRFATLDEAEATAERIFTITGIVVGIEQDTLESGSAKAWARTRGILGIRG